MTDREAMKMALAKLEHLWEIGIDAEYKVELLPEIRVLRQALAQPEHEWVGLTDNEIAESAEHMEAVDPTDSFWREFSQEIEAKLKEKNT